ncbi:autophagy protein ATG11 [Sugiyamaella lignohabitans]|uniref:Autophagy-related protein 11 n=1 Tax=Sugiyamaella lignohabitans TaxID=796027 RepID=A0A161HG25_9ASCO|nr:autophagy protein ATG11 [Sugiyamaella lignohabitans]ANB14610.1 autophagy protein ATG11 [Sugiyamaella lignohabitans]
MTQLKLEAIADGQEVFLFDKSLISPGAKTYAENGLVGKEDRGPPLALPPRPAVNTTSSLSDRFMTHSDWTQKCLLVGKDCGNRVNELHMSINIIKRGLKTSLEHMMRHSQGLKKSFDSKVDFAVDLDQNMQATGEWEVYLEKVKKIELLPAFREQGEGRDRLSSWIDESVIRKANKQCSEFDQKIQNNISHLVKVVNEVIERSTRLEQDAMAMASKDAESDVPAEATSRHVRELLQDLTALANKIQRDSESIGGVSEQTAVRIENLHKREFFPQIEATVNELIGIHEEWQKAKVKCQNLAIGYLSTLSHIQYDTSMVRPELQKLTMLLQTTEDLRATVAQVIDLPFLYGALIIETVRRNHWTGYIRENVSQTAESLATKRLDEIKRRKKWKNHYGKILPKVVDIINEDIAEIEVNFVSGEVNGDGDASSTDSDQVQAYIKLLTSLGLREAAEELEQEHQSMLSQLESDIADKNLAKLETTKQSDHHTDTSSPAKVFKSGTLAEAYTDENAALTAKLKGYESRIRILEDLLHKQQFRGESTRSEANRRSASRDKSHSPGSPRMIERLHFLETQKSNDSKIIAQLEQEKRELAESLSAKELALKDVMTVKSDLLANMLSQETEFIQERKAHHEEVNELKSRIDELELDLDRADEKLQLENDQLREEVDSYKEKIEQLEQENSNLKQQEEKLHKKIEYYDTRTRDLSQRLFTGFKRSCEVLESMGLQVTKEMDGNLITFKVNRVRGLGRRSSAARSEILEQSLEENGNGNMVSNPTLNEATPEDLRVLYWMDGEPDEERYREFINEIYIDYDIFRDSACKRLRDVEHLARKLQKESKHLRERKTQIEEELQSRLSLRSFKVGDLALFLPTRDPTRVPNPWAAFNVNAPHYFLKQEDSHQLSNREYLVGRITHIEERVVNKSLDNDEDNPFDLSDGLRWYLLDAVPAEW